MPRFSLRTLLILTALLGVLFWAWPWTTELYRANPIAPDAYPPPERVFTERFKCVALTEGVILAAWAVTGLIRRRTTPWFDNLTTKSSF